MNAMPVVPVIDPRPVLTLIKQKGGECSFDEAILVLEQSQHLTQPAARDALWRFLSDGTIVFTTDRHLTAPKPIRERSR